jgi:hypothetical protein
MPFVAIKSLMEYESQSPPKAAITWGDMSSLQVVKQAILAYSGFRHVVKRDGMRVIR